MLEVIYEPEFFRKICKIKDNTIKEQVKKQIKKIVENPEIGKPMRFDRKGTRELYIKPYRLSYSYTKHENKVIILDFYHKDEQ